MRAKLATTALLASLALGGVALAPAAHASAPVPIPPAAAQVAPAAAPGFSAAGSWQLFQSNGITVTLNVAQDSAGTLYGSATGGTTVGTIQSGSAVDGTSIYFTIAWSNGALGRYTGTLGPDRRLTGYTYDLNNTSSQANWNTTKTF
jgi:hypothetical protein